MSKVPCRDCLILGMCKGRVDNDVMKLFKILIPKCSILKEYITHCFDKAGRPSFSSLKLNKLKNEFGFDNRIEIKGDGVCSIKVISMMEPNITKRSSKRVRVITFIRMGA